MQASEKDENASSQIHAAGVDLLLRQRGIERRRLEFSTLQYDRFAVARRTSDIATRGAVTSSHQ
jgi:hypothetical protein